MGADAAPLARLRRALDSHNLGQAETAARELPRLEPHDTLRLTLLLLRSGDSRYEPAAVRWVGRLLDEHPEVGLACAGDLAQGFADLGSPFSDVARSRIANAARRAGLDASAELLERDPDVVRPRAD